MMIFTASKTTFVLRVQPPKHNGKRNTHEPITRARNRPSQCRQRPLVPFRPWTFIQLSVLLLQFKTKPPSTLFLKTGRSEERCMGWCCSSDLGRGPLVDLGRKDVVPSLWASVLDRVLGVHVEGLASHCCVGCATRGQWRMGAVESVLEDMAPVTSVYRNLSELAIFLKCQLSTQRHLSVKQVTSSWAL